MFGIADQLLATVALAIGTIVIVNAGRARTAGRAPAAEPTPAVVR